MDFLLQKSKSLNPIKLLYIYIYIYINEKPLHILEIYDFKKMLANTIYNFNIFSKNV